LIGYFDFVIFLTLRTCWQAGSNNFEPLATVYVFLIAILISVD